ncbi:MAG: SoxR reducing system RseC family protein [Gammaproteobacteria bacterium]|nr:SoxR reducing system RseC family protein [Gammaproteobacteria bacterium]
MSRDADTSCLTVAATVVRAAGRHGFDVELDTAERCAGCSGFCMWSWGAQQRSARITSDLPLEVGDRVSVSLPADQVLASTLLLHGLPLGALLAGGAIGAFATQSDLGCLVGAAAGLGATLAAAPRLRRRTERLTAERVRVRARP